MVTAREYQLKYLCFCSGSCNKLVNSSSCNKSLSFADLSKLVESTCSEPVDKFWRQLVTSMLHDNLDIVLTSVKYLTLVKFNIGTTFYPRNFVHSEIVSIPYSAKE